MGICLTWYDSYRHHKGNAALHCFARWMPKVAGVLLSAWLVVGLSRLFYCYSHVSKIFQGFVKMDHQVTQNSCCLPICVLDRRGWGSIRLVRTGIPSSNPRGKECTEWDNVRMLDEQYVESEFQACRYVQIYVLQKMCCVSQPSFLATNRGQPIFLWFVPRYKNLDLVMI